MNICRVDAVARKVLRLDHRSHLPLHAQAERVLRDLLQQPGYRAGALLPNEVSLSRTLGISRNTLRMAIGRLVAEGRLERKSGVGTRIVEPRVQSRVGAWHSFTREMEAKGIRVETYAIKARTVPAPEVVARALQLTEGEPVLCLDRIRGWESKPEVAFRSYFHPRLGLTPEDDFEKPLYEMIQEKTSVRADESIEAFSPVAADKRLAQALGTPVGTPLLRRERTVLDSGRRPIEYAVVHYRCERFKLTLSLSQH